MKDNSNMGLIVEGKAKIYTKLQMESQNMDEDEKCVRTLQANVFYNPAQQLNRDLTVLVLNVYADLVKQSYLKKQES